MKTLKTHANVQFDNLSTPLHPVWRRRLRKPFSCRAIRMELARQAAQQSGNEQQIYLRRRLTELDKALGDDEAEALEAWLDAEEILSGRVKIGDYGDRTGGGSGMASPVPDRVVGALRAHAMAKRAMPHHMRRVLTLLAMMMEAPEWDYAQAGRMIGWSGDDREARRRFINAVQGAAAFLAARATGRGKR